MTGARILVIDGNVAENRARQVAALGYDSGTGYSRVLRRLDASLHIDIVTAAGGEVRANPHGRGTFWGVQYHPEYDFIDIAAVAERYGQTLVTEGMFRDTTA